MDDRGYIAQALFDRLHAEGMRFAVLGDARGYPETAPRQVALAVAREALERVPPLLAAFSQEVDLRLVRLERDAYRSWRAALAWTDEVGRPRIVDLRACSDYYCGIRLVMTMEELLSRAPALRFSYALVDGVLRGPLAEAWLSSLWAEDPRGAIEQIARFWRAPADIRVLAQAARHGEWRAAREAVPGLRRRLRTVAPPRLDALLGHAAVAARRVLQPPRAAVAFVGRECLARTSAMAQVAADLQPLGLDVFEHAAGEARRGDFRVVFGAPEGFDERLEDAAGVAGGQPQAAMVAQAERGILRWLESRVQRRHPGIVVGENPWQARLLQRFPSLGFLLGCAIRAPLRSPVLMPYPYGIVIEAGAAIGSRVTVMQQAMIGERAVIEDNVRIGAGAKVLAGARVGRGAVIEPNAVVSRDVPSHSVAGARRSRHAVVNT